MTRREGTSKSACVDASSGCAPAVGWTRTIGSEQRAEFEIQPVVFRVEPMSLYIFIADKLATTRGHKQFVWGRKQGGQGLPGSTQNHKNTDVWASYSSYRALVQCI